MTSVLRGRKRVAITRDAFVDRFTARVLARCKAIGTKREAELRDYCAKTGPTYWTDWLDDKRDDNLVNAPEAAADVDMSYWEG